MVVTATSEIRQALVEYAAAEGEMVRVFLRGRLAERGAICYVGYPQVGRFTVRLLGTDGHPKAVVRLRAIRSVERVFAANPPRVSKWHASHR